MWKINKWEGSNKKGRGLTKKKKLISWGIYYLELEGKLVQSGLKEKQFELDEAVPGSCPLYTNVNQKTTVYHTKALSIRYAWPSLTLF